MVDVWWFIILTIKLRFSLSNIRTQVSDVVYFKSKKELNYDRFVDQNVLDALLLVHSDLRIYLISFSLTCAYAGVAVQWLRMGILVCDG